MAIVVASAKEKLARLHGSIMRHKAQIQETTEEAVEGFGTALSAGLWGFIKNRYPKAAQAHLFGTELPLVPALAVVGWAGSLAKMGGKVSAAIRIPCQGVVAGESYSFGGKLGARGLRRASIKAVSQRQEQGWYDPEDKVWFQ